MIESRYGGRPMSLSRLGDNLVRAGRCGGDLGVQAASLADRKKREGRFP